MKLWTTFLLLLLLPATVEAAVRVIVPNVAEPQDALDAAISIPDAGVGIALSGFDQGSGTGTFLLVSSGSITGVKVESGIETGAELELIAGCDTFVLGTGSDYVELLFSCAKPYALLLANSIDANVSAAFLEYLRSMGVAVEKVSASEFQSRKDAENIIILGGPDAPEGVGEVVREVLTEEEQSSLRIPGNRGIFIHENPWHPGAGTITVLAGSDRYETWKAAWENRERFTLEN